MNEYTLNNLAALGAERAYSFAHFDFSAGGGNFVYAIELVEAGTS